MIVAGLVLLALGAQGEPKVPAHAAERAAILFDLQQRGFEAEAIGGYAQGILRDPRTGFDGIWRNGSSVGDISARLTIRMDLVGPLDRDLLRRALSPEDREKIGEVSVDIGGTVRIPAGRSDDDGSAWMKAVGLARRIALASGRPTVRGTLKSRVLRGGSFWSLDESGLGAALPLNLRVTSITHWDMEDVAEDSGWSSPMTPAETMAGGGSGRLTLSRWPAPGVRIAVVPDGSHLLFAGEARQIEMDVWLSNRGEFTDVQRAEIRSFLPRWDTETWRGTLVRFTLDVSKGMTLREIARTLTREGERASEVRRRLLARD